MFSSRAVIDWVDDEDETKDNDNAFISRSIAVDGVPFLQAQISGPALSSRIDYLNPRSILINLGQFRKGKWPAFILSVAIMIRLE